MLMNPTNPINLSSTLAEVEQAARDLALQIQIVNASTSHEIDAAFAALSRERPDALFVAPTGSSPAGASNWLRWQPAMQFQRRFRCASMSKPGG
jgi:DNA-binding LacI/PurR family transcriptional regulator